MSDTSPAKSPASPPAKIGANRVIAAIVGLAVLTVAYAVVIVG